MVMDQIEQYLYNSCRIYYWNSKMLMHHRRIDWTALLIYFLFAFVFEFESARLNFFFLNMILRRHLMSIIKCNYQVSKRVTNFPQ